METMSEQEHHIKIRSLQEWYGDFNKDMIGECVQMDMQMEEEVSISFTCTCGEKFYKKHKAEEHLLEQ
jgi:hypothetical protein